VKYNAFVLFCLVVPLSALSSVIAYADTEATDQTEEKQKDPLKVVLIKEIIDDHKDAIAKESGETGVPPAVIVAVIATESTNNPRAVSSKGARGLMQTLPVADETTGVKCNGKESACQIKKGTRYIQHLVENEGIGQWWSRVFLAYNEGPSGSRRFNTPKKVSGHSYVKKCTEYLRIAQAVFARKI
jgi:soluble lytic murein transglycosylase